MKKLLTAILILFMAQGAWAGENPYKRFSTQEVFKLNPKDKVFSASITDIRGFILKDSKNNQEYLLIMSDVYNGWDVAITKLDKVKK